MIKPAAEKLDVRLAVANQKIRDVRHVAERLPHSGILQLLEQCAGKAHVQPRHIGVAFEHPRDAVVTPQDLAGLPALTGIVQCHQISWWLVQVQSECVKDFRHNE